MTKRMELFYYVGLAYAYASTRLEYGDKTYAKSEGLLKRVIDEIISKLNQKQIRRVIELIDKQKNVNFTAFDYMDCIAKAIDIIGDHKELKRLKGMLALAATNVNEEEVT